VTDDLTRERDAWKRAREANKKRKQRLRKRMESGQAVQDVKFQKVQITIPWPKDWRGYLGASDKDSLVAITECHINICCAEYRKRQTQEAWDLVRDIRAGDLKEYVPLNDVSLPASGAAPNTLTEEQLNLAHDVGEYYSEAEEKMIEQRGEDALDAEDRWKRGKGWKGPLKGDS
jgi:hypothetical protein